jgi:hypothetical protein
MQDQTLQQLLKTLTKGLDLSEDTLLSMQTLFTLEYLKSLLVHLILFKSFESNFLKYITIEFNNYIAALPSDLQKQLTEVMQKEQTRILNDIFQKIQTELGDEDKKKLEENLKTLQ